MSLTVYLLSFFLLQSWTACYWYLWSQLLTLSLHLTLSDHKSLMNIIKASWISLNRYYIVCMLIVPSERHESYPSSQVGFSEPWRRKKHSWCIVNTSGRETEIEGRSRIFLHHARQGRWKHFSFGQAKYSGSVTHLCRGCKAVIILLSYVPPPNRTHIHAGT